MNGKKQTKEILICVSVAIGILVAPGRDSKADFVFGEPENLGPAINTSSHDYDPGLTENGLYFCFLRLSLDQSTLEAWVAQRETRHDPWGNPISLGLWLDTDASVIAMTNAYDEILQGETIPGWDTADGLETYFSDNRTGGYGGTDLYVQKRESVDAEWGPPENLGPNVNTGNNDIWGPVSADGLTLYFSSFGRPHGYGRSDLYVTTRPTRSNPWGVATNLGPAVNSPHYDISPILSPDGLLFIFESGRPSGEGEGDLWMARRASLSDPWEQAMHLGATVNSSTDDGSPYISADGSTLYFQSTRPGGYGGYDLWQVPIIPIVDFNGDGKVDGREILIMAASWNQGDPWLDIGPYAWGDGIIDVQDVAALAKYIGKDVYDPTLVAHWPLDETEGIVTRESISGDDLYVLGDPTWAPNGGKVGGALQLDGVDACVVANFNLDPAEGPFSVLAWIKGGAPGQVIISQVLSANCLMLDAEGRLMTELTSPGRNSSPLLSEAVIDDGQWHRIGLIWDGLAVKLCVDETVVAEGMQDSLGGSGNGLYIGAGNSMQTGSFFSGLIDDVRVYNRAIKP